MDAEERELFAKSLEPATTRHSGAALDAALDELGWRDAFVADAPAAVATLFELQGAAGSTSSALADVVIGGLGLDPAPDLGVVLPRLGATTPPGARTGERLAADGLALGGMVTRTRVLVVTGDGAAGDGAEPVGSAVVAPDDLGTRAVDGLDPRLGLVEVSGEVSGDVAGEPVSDPIVWAEGIAAGQRALAHELVGASRTMLELARTHALERVQFGRPIAGFQAVRHRLAESLVAIEAAEGAALAAWDDGTPFGAALGKAIAGRSARVVARHCQQVLAGIGFTTEHDLHLHVRRTIVLDRLLGDARSLTRQLGEDLLARRSLPAILPL